MNRFRRRVFVCLAVALCGPHAGAAVPAKTSGYDEAAVKAAFLIRFTGYIDWPVGGLEKDFVIVVVSAPRVADELVALTAGRPIKGLPVRVVHEQGTPERGRADLVYVGATFGGDLRRLTAPWRGRPVLLVSDQTRGLDEGAMINFVVVDQRVRFEVSQPAIRDAELKVSSALLAVAVRVR